MQKTWVSKIIRIEEDVEKKTLEIIERLNGCVKNNDFIYKSEIIVNDLRSCQDSRDAIDLLFRLIEDNPTVDFGMPGPLVHFLESFYGNGYEEKLLESLRRSPTFPTVSMLNRLINGVSLIERDTYLTILHKVFYRTDVSQKIRSLAKDFYNHQLGESEEK